MGTITKALDMLNLFSRSRPEIGQGEAVALTGRDKATVHRHLVELARNGMLEQHPVTRKYRLGPALLRLAAVREATFPLQTLVHPIVAALAEEVGELVHLSVLQDDVLTPVCHADPRRHRMQVQFDEAETLPPHATASGIAVLAFGAAAQCDALLARPLASHTRHTVVDREKLAALIDEARAHGIGRSDRGFDAEVVSQAAPIFGPAPEALGAIAVAMPITRATGAGLQTIADALRGAALAASRSLGGEVSHRAACDMRMETAG